MKFINFLLEIFKIICCKDKHLDRKLHKAHYHEEVKDENEPMILRSSNLSGKDNIEDELKYSCNHPHCEAKFKTRRQGMTHHMKCDNECKKEKHGIIRLIATYKETICNIAKKSNSQKNRELYLALKKEFREFVKEKDPLRLEYFNCIINVE